MKYAWIAIPYLCIIAYVFFIFGSTDRCMEGMNDFYEMPYHVNREVREIWGRLQGLRNSLPLAFASPQIHFQQIEEMLEEHNRQQDQSIRLLKERFPNDPDGLFAELDKAIEDLRSARVRVARATEGNDDMDFALSYYNAEIGQPLEKINEVLRQISKAADDKGKEIRASFETRHLVIKFIAVLLGFLIVAALIFSEMRDKAKKRIIAHRERLFNLLSDTVDDVFIIFNKDGQVEYASSNSDRVLGVPYRKISKDQSTLYKALGDDVGKWLKARSVDLSNEGGEICANGEKPGQKLNVRVYPVVDDNKVDRHIAVISDETESVARQQALSDALANSRQANEAKSSFLAHMSHEIRTPMNAIIGMTTIALARKDDLPKVEDCLCKISQSSHHLLGLINDVLDMSKIEGGKLAISRELFELSAVLENLVNIIHPQSDERKQHFEVSLGGVDVEWLYGDPLRLNQILLNLLSNATKFTPADGKINFRIEQMEKKSGIVWLRFIVKDTGIGMSKDYQARLYQPFEQATPGVAAKFGGSGLGLAITRNLVTLMGGVINLKSEEGSGTEFKVELPFGLPERELLRERAALTPRRILVVDDDLETCEHVKIMLEDMGMTVDIAGGGKEAVGMVKGAHNKGIPYEVCFMDWKMPEVNGEMATREIRSNFGNETLVIIISAYDWNSIEEKAKAAGASGFVSKPFFASNLHDALMSLGGKANVNVQPERSHNFSGKRVLLVEDNEFNREIGQEFLEMALCKVDNAGDGKEALEKFRSSSPGYYDLILMDIQMPVMNGYEAAQAIRNLDRDDAATIPILAMTANAFNEDVAKAMAAGMNNHIPKPINVDELYAKMANYLNH